MCLCCVYELEETEKKNIHGRSSSRQTRIKRGKAELRIWPFEKHNKPSKQLEVVMNNVPFPLIIPVDEQCKIYKGYITLRVCLTRHYTSSTTKITNEHNPTTTRTRNILFKFNLEPKANYRVLKSWNYSYQNIKRHSKQSYCKLQISCPFSSN